MPRVVAMFAVLALAASACSVTPDAASSDAGASSSSSSAASSPAVARPASPTATAGSVDSSPPSYALTAVPVGAVTTVAGLDWSQPSWVRPAANSGFFSEEPDAQTHVVVRSVDQSWAQLAPRQGVLDTTQSGSAQNMSFDSLDDQLAKPGLFWMRIFASGESWAPDWVAAQCKVHGYGPDYDGVKHLPIWDPCVWKHLLETYTSVFVDKGLAADPRLRFVYVPGAFTWAEYDYETIASAVDAGDLDFATYKKWYDHAWTDLATIFGPHKNKLVFTGEDYPFGPFTHAQQDQLAKQATGAGIGIRNGITEEFNFHLSEAPAYGSHVQPDGHLTLDASLPVHDGTHVVGTENECYNDCGFHTTDVPYAVVQSNLKALQLGVNWLYVVPLQSAMLDEPQHWDWVRLSLGQTAATSADAWADLRDAEDTYWSETAPPFTTKASWPTRPWVRNLERWLVQRDVPGGVARRATVDIRRKVFVEENGTSYEGLSTDIAHGQNALYLDLDDRFVASTRGQVQVKVTAWGRSGALRVQTGAGLSAIVRPSGRPRWETSTVTLDSTGFTGALAGHTDLALVPVGGADAVVRLVRVVRLAPPA